MPYAKFLAISATIVALVLSACSGSSRGSTSSTVPATSVNPVQRENSRPGTPGWEIPAGAGTVITGYASETSVEWEAYNRWGSKSLYQFGTSMYAVEVSFDRPFDQQVFYDMVPRLKLPWVRFLERNGIDVSYQTDVDTDRAPRSLLHHRLGFAIGHDEYWTQRMRGAFNRALALSTNLMFGSNSGEWRMRYAVGRRTPGNDLRTRHGG